MEKIKILSQSTVPGQGYYLTEIEAIPIQIKGWEEFKFYVHKSDNNNFITYKVTDASCGVSVGIYAKNKIKAIAAAEKLLNQKGKEAFIEVRKQYVELFNGLYQ